MPEEPTGAAPAPAAVAPENPVAGVSKNGFDPAAVQPNNSPEPTEPTDPNAPEGEEGEEGADDAFEDDGKDPDVAKRKTAKDFIIERQQRKIEKMKAQEGEDDEENDDEDDPEADPVPNGDDPKDNDGNSPEMEAMKPIVEQHLADQDAQEVTKFLEDNPDFAPYTAKVERLMKHESRRQIPVDELFYAAAGKHLLKVGADRARKADAEAKGTQSGGGSNREGLSPIDWSTATPTEMEAEKQRIRQGAR